MLTKLVFALTRSIRFYGPRVVHNTTAQSIIPAVVRYNGRYSLRSGRRHDILLATAAAAVGLVYCDSTRNRRDTDETLLLRATKLGDLKTVKRLIKSSVEVNTRHSLGWTPIHVAVINSNINILKELVTAGANVNVQDEFSSSQRVAANRRVHASQVADLRDNEFCSWINQYVSYSGFTPLHYAIISDNESIIRYLLDNGADPSIENNVGRTPSDYCVNEAIKQLLKTQEEKLTEQKFKKSLEERRKFPLQDQLRNHIIGQEGPIITVANAIRRKEMGWGDSEHPLVLLFLGSSGIGKTELAKQVANYIHKSDPKGFIRIDMSEYQQKHEVSKLIGAPPGYIGYDKGGQLTERLRECPNAVVLFDEIDKAHPDILTVLLQLFDEGRLTDGQGQTISCKEAIFVMTSNLASDEIAQHALRLRKEAEHRNDNDDDDIEISRQFKEGVVEPILKYHFQRDEFLGRINEMVYFVPFSRGELNQLVQQELLAWSNKAKERHNISLTWDKEVVDILVDGYNVKYGARSIHHEVERRVITIIAQAFECGTISKDSNVHLVVIDNGKPIITIK